METSTFCYCYHTTLETTRKELYFPNLEGIYLSVIDFKIFIEPFMCCEVSLRHRLVRPVRDVADRRTLSSWIQAMAMEGNPESTTMLLIFPTSSRCHQYFGKFHFFISSPFFSLSFDYYVLGCCFHVFFPLVLSTRHLCLVHHMFDILRIRKNLTNCFFFWVCQCSCGCLVHLVLVYVHRIFVTLFFSLPLFFGRSQSLRFITEYSKRKKNN